MHVLQDVKCLERFCLHRELMTRQNMVKIATVLQLALHGSCRQRGTETPMCTVDGRLDFVADHSGTVHLHGA